MSLPPTPAVPPRPPRDLRMDVMRGLMQVFIVWSHTGLVQAALELNPGMGFLGHWFIHAAWGLSDSSEMFVILSGFTLGSLGARQALRDGWPAMAAGMLGRAWRLYLRHLVVFALMGALVLGGAAVLGWPQAVPMLGWGWLMEAPLTAALAVPTMLFQPVFMGVLPLFVVCIAVLPAFLRAVDRAGAAALAVPVGLYAAVWLAGLGVPSLAPHTGIGFNPFGWQVLFFLGAWLGRRALLEGRALALPFWLVAAAALVVLLGLLMRLGWLGLFPMPIEESAAWVGKEDLALPRVLHALALVVLAAAWIPREAAWMRTAIGDALATIGRSSLQAFCLGLFVATVLAVALAALRAGPAADLAAMAGSAVVLALGTGWRHGWGRRIRPA
jgi:hypothetical protein